MAFIYDLSDTWNAGATTFTAIKMNVTDTASAAGSKLIDLQVGGTTRFDVDKNGQVEISAGTALLPSLSTLGDTNTGMWFPAADTIAWSTGGSEKMRILSTGEVGIGTSTPSTALDIRSAAAFSPQLLLANSTVDTSGPYWNTRKLRGTAAANSGDFLGTFVFQSVDTGGTVRNAAFLSVISEGAGATFHSAYYSFTLINTAGSNVIPLAIRSQGLLTVDGTALLPSFTFANDPNTGFWRPAADTIAWSTGGSERMRITSGGNIGIGTTNPGSQLHIASSVAFNPSLILQNTTDNAFGPYWYSRKTRITAPANSGDALGTFIFTSPDSGGTVQNACYIEALSAGAGATWHSGYFRFISFDTSGTFGVRLIVDSQGVLLQQGTALLPSLTRNGDNNTGMWFPAADTIAWSTNGGERLRITSGGNLGLGTSTFGTSAAVTLAIATGTAPTTGPADTIQIYSTDLSAGNTMLSLFTEGTVVNTNTTAAATHRIAIRVNGTVYYLLANTAA